MKFLLPLGGLLLFPFALLAADPPPTGKIAEREARLQKARQEIAALPAAERPSELYVAKEACPFECCMFGEWSVEEKIELFKAPDGAKLGRSLEPGDEVLGLTGEVHLRPRPLLVGYPFTAEKELGSAETIAIPAGAVVYQLDSLGEGFGRFWYRGAKFEAPLDLESGNRCPVFTESCWADFLDPEGTPVVYQWWVKVRLKDGSEAWARDQGFGNMDGCA